MRTHLKRKFLKMQINKVQSWFFKKVKKTDVLLSRWIKRKKREDANYHYEE